MATELNLENSFSQVERWLGTALRTLAKLEVELERGADIAIKPRHVHLREVFRSAIASAKITFTSGPNQVFTLGENGDSVMEEYHKEFKTCVDDTDREFVLWYISELKRCAKSFVKKVNPTAYIRFSIDVTEKRNGAGCAIYFIWMANVNEAGGLRFQANPYLNDVYLDSFFGQDANIPVAGGIPTTIVKELIREMMDTDMDEFTSYAELEELPFKLEVTGDGGSWTHQPLKWSVDSITSFLNQYRISLLNNAFLEAKEIEDEGFNYRFTLYGRKVCSGKFVRTNNRWAVFPKCYVNGTMISDLNNILRSL